MIKLQLEHKVFLSVIENVVAWASTSVAIITQFSDQFVSRVISLLIKGISRVLQKLLRYFECTIISRFFVPLSLVWPVSLSLRLNESVILASVKSVTAQLLSTPATSL